MLPSTTMPWATTVWLQANTSVCVRGCAPTFDPTSLFLLFGLLFNTLSLQKKFRCWTPLWVGSRTRYIRTYDSNVLREGGLVLTQYPLWLVQQHTNIATTLHTDLSVKGEEIAQRAFSSDYRQVCRPKKHSMQCGVLHTACSCMHSCPAGCKQPAATDLAGAVVVINTRLARHPHASKHAHEQSVLTAAWLAGKHGIVDCCMPNTKRAAAG